MNPIYRSLFFVAESQKRQSQKYKKSVKAKIQELKNKGYDWSTIADQIRDHFPNLSEKLFIALANEVFNPNP